MFQKKRTDADYFDLQISLLALKKSINLLMCAMQ